MAAAAFFLLGGGAIVATTGRRGTVVTTDAGGPRGPHRVQSGVLHRSGRRAWLSCRRSGGVVHPPTATQFWRTVLVSEVGIAVLLAIGLNVVVGWAGLLDLGYIAFYAIARHATSPARSGRPAEMAAGQSAGGHPLAVGACIAGGRGAGTPDAAASCANYRAIVTLGFGDHLRRGQQRRRVHQRRPWDRGGPDRVVYNSELRPSISVTFRSSGGLNQLQYWYLLLILIFIVLIAFNRLEYSRLGRSWAAIRERTRSPRRQPESTRSRSSCSRSRSVRPPPGLAGCSSPARSGSSPRTTSSSTTRSSWWRMRSSAGWTLPGAVAGARLTWLPSSPRTRFHSRTGRCGRCAALLMMIFRSGGLIPARRRQAELHGPATPPRRPKRSAVTAKACES